MRTEEQQTESQTYAKGFIAGHESSWQSTEEGIIVPLSRGGNQVSIKLTRSRWSAHQQENQNFHLSLINSKAGALGGNRLNCSKLVQTTLAGLCQAHPLDPRSPGKGSHREGVLKEETFSRTGSVGWAPKGAENHTCLISCTRALSPTTKSRIGKDCGICASLGANKWFVKCPRRTCRHTHTQAHTRSPTSAAPNSAWNGHKKKGPQQAVRCWQQAPAGIRARAKRREDVEPASPVTTLGLGGWQLPECLNLDLPEHAKCQGRRRGARRGWGVGTDWGLGSCSS